MTRNQTLLGGACLLLIGLLVGYAAGSGGPDIEDIDAAIAERLDAAGAAEAERVAALEAKVDELGGRLDPEKVTATLVDGRLTVRIGAVDGAAPRKIEISTFRPELESAAQPAIEAQSQDQSEASSQA